MLKLFRYLKPVWWEIVIDLILLTGQAYLQLELPNQMANITAVVTNQTLDAATKQSQIWSTGLVMLVIAGIIVITAVVQSLFTSHIASTFGKNVREAVFTKVQEFSPTEFDKFGTASLITRTTNDVAQIQFVILMGMRVMVMSPVTLIVAVMKTLGSNAKLAIVLAISIPIILIAIVITFFFASPLFAKIQKAIDRVTLILREGLTGVRVVRAFNRQEKESKRFDEANEHMTNMIVKVGRTMSFVNPVITIVMDLTYLGVFFYGFALMDGVPINEIDPNSIGTMMAVAQYAMQIMMAFLMFALVFIMVPRASASAARVNAVLNAKPSIKDVSKPVTTENKAGHVEFRDVTFAFANSAAPTLQNISFDAKPGEVTAIIGSTGSGKSTVINLIPRLYDVTGGQVLVDGVDVREYTQHDLREKIGFVPQQALLFSGSIKDNLRFGKKDATDEEMWAAADVAQASHFINKKDTKLETDVSQGGKNFSGGQKQRIAIARALVKKPEIYIFDDSFSALDFKTDIKLRRALKEYTKTSSVLIVAQRVSTIIDADHIVVLNEGKIVGQGKHADLLKNCLTYREIVLSQLDPEEINKTMLLTRQALSTEGGDQ